MIVATVTLTTEMTRDEANEWKRRVGASATTLRDLLREGFERRAWVSLGHQTWTECLQALADEYGFSERHLWRLHSANQVQGLLTPGSVDEIPEKQLRPLAELRDNPELQREAWQRAIETAPNGKITAAHVEQAVDEVLKRPHVAQNTGENEWYTPPEYIEAARLVLGKIDLDPASTEAANKIVGAKTFYSKDDNGLDHEWRGRVWMNPPYAAELIKPFASKFAMHVKAGDISAGIVLVNNATETAWFRDLIDCASAVVFPYGRVKFLDPQGNPGAPLQGQAFIYFGQAPDRFISQFAMYGWSARP